MASLRAGRVFDALSSGLGLFAEKSMLDEQERIDKQWEITLSNMRETAAGKRQEASFAHSEQLARDADTAAQTRFETQTAATGAYRTQQLTAEQERHQQTRVDNARKSLQDTLLNLEKEQGDALEDVAFNPEMQAQIMERYTDLKDQAITGTVSWLASQDLPGYQIEDEQGLQSLLIQSGMDVGGAADHAKQIWGSISGAGTAPSPNMAEIYSGGGTDAGGMTQQGRLDRIAGYEAELAGLSGSQTQAAGPTIAAPGIAPPTLRPGPPGTDLIPPAGAEAYRSPNQRTMENIVNPAGRAIRDWLRTTPGRPDDDLYKLMGQRGR